MDTNQSQSLDNVEDHNRSLYQSQSLDNVEDHNRSLYLTLYQADLTHTTIKWTVTSFFMGISFALLGFSFQVSLPFTSAFAVRIAALAIYWFAYVLYLHYYVYNVFLREYLTTMETSGRVYFDVQQETQKSLRKGNKLLRVKRLLLSFGIIYGIGIILLLILKF